MTITVDHSKTLTPAKGVVHMLDGARLMLRLGLRIGAVLFALVTALIWVAPGANWESDIMFFKLALSLMSGFIAFDLWQRSLPPLAPSVEVDVAKMEVRVIRDGAPVHKRLIERCAFDDLDAVDLNGRHIILWCKGNRLLADITLSNATAHAELLGALRSVGKLA